MTDLLHTTKWSIPQVLLALAGGFVGAQIATLAAFVTLGSELTPTVFALSFVGQAVGSVAAMWLMSRISGTGNLGVDFALTLHVGQMWGIVAGMGLQIAVAIAVAPLIRALYPDGPPQQVVAEVAEEAGGVLEIVLVFISAGILAPVVEEMIFRGMLFPRLAREQRWEVWQFVIWLLPLAILIPLVLIDVVGNDAVGYMDPAQAAIGFAVWTLLAAIAWLAGRRSVVAWAVIIQAVAFAAIHLLDPNAIAVIPGVFLIGLVLGFAAAKTRNLSLPIFIHSGVNLLAAALLVFGGPIADWLEEIDEAAIGLFLGLGG